MTFQRSRKLVASEQLEVRELLACDTVTATYLVDDVGDFRDGDLTPGHVSLRDAVSLANANPGCDRIEIAEALADRTIELVRGELVIRDDVEIVARGKSLEVSGLDESRLFRVTSGNSLLLQSFSLTNGATDDDGGAISNSGSITLIDMEVKDTQARQGGAIWSGHRTSVTIQNSRFLRNSASLRGGAVQAEGATTTLDVSGSRFEGNKVEGTNGQGGGAIVAFDGSVNISDSVFTENTVSQWGGAVILRNGTLSVDTSQFEGNVAGSNSGAIEVVDSTSIIRDSQFDENTSGFRGGAIQFIRGSLTVSNSRLTRNASDQDGGAIMGWHGELNVVQSELVGNTARFGGGVAAQGNLTLNIIGSTIADNSTSESGGGVQVIDSSVNIFNSTISGNSSGTRGGGVHGRLGGSITIANSTITLNEAKWDGGGIRVWPETEATIANTIVASNDGQGDNDDAIGAVTSLGGNLIGTSSDNSFIDGLFGDLVGTPGDEIGPLLGPLADFGGPTRTHSLLADSLAINRGRNELIPMDVLDADGDGITDESLPTDQRMLRRINGERVDIGAFESAQMTLDLAPVAVDDVLAVFEDVGELAVTNALLSNDFDPEEQRLSVVGVDASETQGAVKLVEGVVLYSPNSQFDNLEDGDYASDSFTYTISDGSNVATATMSILVLGKSEQSAPYVVSFLRDDGETQFDKLEKLTIEFSEDVSASLSVEDLTLFNAATDQAVDISNTDLIWNEEQNTASWNIADLRLAPGAYFVGISSFGVQDASGNALDGDRDGEAGDDFQDSLIVTWRGDSDRDLDVDFTDFLVLSSNFGRTSIGWSEADFDNDGVVGFTDFLYLSANFGNSVAP